MKTLGYLVLGITVGSFAVPAYADREKNENGHGRHQYERQVGKGGEFKEEYWDGNCKVKRKLERNGSYEEERKCEGPGRHVGKGGEFKEEYWDGNCKVKRKLERNGSYEEE